MFAFFVVFLSLTTGGVKGVGRKKLSSPQCMWNLVGWGRRLVWKASPCLSQDFVHIIPLITCSYNLSKSPNSLSISQFGPLLATSLSSFSPLLIFSLFSSIILNLRVCMLLFPGCLDSWLPVFPDSKSYWQDIESKKMEKMFSLLLPCF